MPTGDVERESFNVSAAHPVSLGVLLVDCSSSLQDKIVVNGVDLVNRAQLSNSQNRELQRFIDNNSHLLGFYDRARGETAMGSPSFDDHVACRGKRGR